MGRIRCDLLFRAAAPNPLDRIKSKAVLAKFRIPDDEAQYDGSSCLPRDSGGSGCRAGQMSEEVDKQSFRGHHVLVHEHTHRFPLMQSAKGFAGEVIFVNRAAPSQTAISFDQGIDQGIVQSPRHEGDAMPVDTVGKGTELPIPEMSGKKEKAAALTLRAGKILVAIIDDPSLDIAAATAREVGEVGKHSPEALKAGEQYMLAAAHVPVRISQFEVPQTHSA